jgi:3-deoxy-D-manno-octulosonic-acid transferase
MTGQGLKVARQQFNGVAECFHAPLDLAGIVGRVFRKLRPSLYVCLETELWPSIIRCVHRNGVPLLLLNGRLSEKSCRRYGRLRFLFRDLLTRFARIAAIRQVDADRFITLGADPEKVSVSGNVKYDLVPAAADGDAGAEYRRRLGIAADTAVMVAGSTHTGEEAEVLEAFRLVQGMMPDMVLILAPRHLRRVAEIEAEFVRLGVSYDLFSRLEDGGRKQNVVLVDTMGELSRLYAAATYVFCGGSLVQRGGHNIMEAAAWNKPVIYGPSMKDFRDAQELLESAGAGFLVHSGRELAERIVAFAEQPDSYSEAARKAGEVCRAQQGAAARQAAMIVEALAAKDRVKP